MEAEGQGQTVFRQIWSNNIDAEFELMKQIIKTHKYIAVDCEFPGVIEPNPAVQGETAVQHKKERETPLQVLAKIVQTTDAHKLIQVGLAFMDESASGNPHVWEVSFSDFDIDTDPYSEISVNFLVNNGMDFRKLKRDGVKLADFLALLRETELLSNPNKRFICFQGEMDFGYLLRALHGHTLPAELEEFYALLKLYFPMVIDVKHLSVEELGYGKGGLNILLDTFDIKRVGSAHNAGSDAYMTLLLYLSIKRNNMGRRSPERHINVLRGLHEVKTPQK